MLSDKLYANKFKSIIRELASNARDSHDEAGVTEPFVITAPTHSCPELSVEDFGTGLDPELRGKPRHSWREKGGRATAQRIPVIHGGE